MLQTRDVMRDARIQIALQDEDATLASVADTEGITWQRVQQIRNRLQNYEKPNRRAKAVYEIVEAACTPGVTGYHDVQKSRGHVYRTVKDALVAAEMLDAVEKLWAMRRETTEKAELATRRAEMIDQMRALGKRLKRTPSSADLNAPRSGTPSAAKYIHYFDSLRLAQAAAGFPPRGLGSHGHVKRRPNAGEKKSTV